MYTVEMDRYVLYIQYMESMSESMWEYAWEEWAFPDRYKDMPY